MQFIFKNFLTEIERYLLPSHCAVCGKNGPVLCPGCRARIPKLKPACPACGQKNVLGLFCPACKLKHTHYHFDGVFAYGAYEKSGLKPALSALKYQGAQTIGLMLGKMLGKQLAIGWRKIPTFLATQTPIIIPMPLHARRHRERGYNQALLIAQGVAATTGWPINTNLKRLSYQSPSAQATYQARAKQKKLFYCAPTDFNNKIAILVDDVFTTGATAQAASLALKQAGVKTILMATIAQSI